MDKKRSRRDSEDYDFPPLKYEKKTEEVEDKLDLYELESKVKTAVKDALNEIDKSTTTSSSVYTFRDAKNDILNFGSDSSKQNFLNMVKTGLGLLSIIGAGYGAFTASSYLSRQGKEKPDEESQKMRLLPPESEFEGKIIKEDPEEFKSKIQLRGNQIILPRS